MHAEIKAFEGLWPGGYWEGDPADPHTVSSYSAIDMNEGYASQAAVRAEKRICAEELGFLSTLHVVYLMCIRNRVRDKVVLEIGPGRGAWSKAILESGAARLFALDALSAEHNQFFPYVDPAGFTATKSAIGRCRTSMRPCPRARRWTSYSRSAASAISAGPAFPNTCATSGTG